MQRQSGYIQKEKMAGNKSVAKSVQIHFIKKKKRKKKRKKKKASYNEQGLPKFS